MITGIIPSAGKAKRWFGYPKELLPFGEDRWLIDYCIDAMVMGGVEQICIISSEKKINAHVQHFSKEKYKNLNLFYTIQKEELDIWGAVKASLPFTTDINYFGMPDTIFNPDSFKQLKDMCQYFTYDFVMGTFNTDHPENYGVWHENKIVNKVALPVNNDMLYRAWGTFLFTDLVVKLWNENNIESYTDAINLAIDNAGFHYINLHYYYDFRNWSEYRSWIDGKQ